MRYHSTLFLIALLYYNIPGLVFSYRLYSSILSTPSYFQSNHPISLYFQYHFEVQSLLSSFSITNSIQRYSAQSRRLCSTECVEYSLHSNSSTFVKNRYVWQTPRFRRLDGFRLYSLQNSNENNENTSFQFNSFPRKNNPNQRLFYERNNNYKSLSKKDMILPEEYPKVYEKSMSLLQQQLELLQSMGTIVSSTSKLINYRGYIDIFPSNNNDTFYGPLRKCHQYLSSLVYVLYREQPFSVQNQRQKNQNFSKKQIIDALSLIRWMPLEIWNHVILQRYIVVCLRSYENISYFLNFIYGIVDYDKRNREYNGTQLLSLRSLISLIDGFGRLGDMKSVNYFYDLRPIYVDTYRKTKIKSSDYNFELSFDIGVNTAYLSAMIKSNCNFTDIYQTYHRVKSENRIDMVTLLTLSTYYLKQNNLSLSMSIWHDLKSLKVLKHINSINPYQEDEMKAYSSVKSQLLKCYLNNQNLSSAIQFIREVYDMDKDYNDLLIMSSAVTYHMGCNKEPPGYTLKVLYAILHPTNDFVLSSINSQNIANISGISSMIYDWIENGMNISQNLSFYQHNNNNVNDIETYNDPIGSLLSGYLYAKEYLNIVMIFIGIFSSPNQQYRLDSLETSNTGYKTSKDEIRREKEYRIEQYLRSGKAYSYISSKRIYLSERSFTIYLSAITQLLGPTSTIYKNISLRKELVGFTYSLLKQRVEKDQLSDISLSIGLLFTSQYSVTSKDNLSEVQYLWDNYKGIKSNNMLSHYIRCFTISSQYSLLCSIIPINLITMNHQRKLVIRYKSSTSSSSLPSSLSNHSDYSEIYTDSNSRLVDELIQAYQRVGGMPIAMNLCFHIISQYKQIQNVVDSSYSYNMPMDFNNKIERNELFSNYPIQYLLIYFDRHWRDYEVETLWNQEYSMLSHNRLSDITEYNSNSNNNNNQRSIFHEAKQLSSILIYQVKDSPNIQINKEMMQWSTIISALLSRGLWHAAVNILQSFELYMLSSPNSSRASHIVSQTIKLSVLAAIQGEFPLMIPSAITTHKRFVNIDGISSVSSSSSLSSSSSPSKSLTVILSSIPQYERFSGGSRKTVCRSIDIIDFLTVGSDSQSLNHQGYKIPIAVSLIESLFIEMIDTKKFTEAASVMKLLGKSRLIIDIDPAYLMNDGISSNSTASLSIVEQVRVRLAQKWAAQLLGKSLNRLKKDVTESIIKVSVANAKKWNEQEILNNSKNA